MILELSFVLIGGTHIGLEKSWEVVESIMKKYHGAKWEKEIDWENKRGKYVVEIN